jgi:nitroimidazol reductase NimA-like FMN-containing flavoprotein (pyridoxamine 5'-phosphate oxidase superfamily)
MVEFSKKEVEFLNSLEECRLATSHNNIPHVKPVSYIYEDSTILIATDYNTRTYKNIKENQVAALVIDVYKQDKHRAVCMQGKVSIIESGSEFLRIYKKFLERFDWVKKQPWKENEAPFLKITPTSKVSWGIN